MRKLRSDSTFNGLSAGQRELKEKWLEPELERLGTRR